ncbi:MAG: TonB-dependent receptor [Arenimonas sp.]
MASKIITKGLKRTALSVALGMCFAGSVFAQSNSTGSIAGTTTAGASVVIENAATGFRREVTADANGNYRVGSLATGSYKVTAGGQSRDVQVTIGGTAQGTSSLGVVTVTGGASINAIDVSSVESTTILTSEQIAKIPVPRNITAVALLAPGTVRGDAAFGNLASFGGGAVSENQYYVNGFNITNAFKNLNFGQIPFEAIAEQQVKTGGYGAEFGRSTGGVINLVTKRGSNEFHAGGNIFYTPQTLRGTNPNVYTRGGLNVITGATDPVTLLSDNSQDETGSNTTAAVWASGALVQDRLFAYALLQYGRTSGFNNFGSVANTANTGGSVRTPTWLVKLDWNINDSNILELTSFSDVAKSETDVYRTVPGTFGLGRGAYLGTVFDKAGGTSWALKYTGYLTDSFTLSALYGHGESSRSDYGVTAGGVTESYNGVVGDYNNPSLGCPVITDIRTGVSTGVVAPITGCNFIGTLGSTKAKDERDQFRIDAEWQLGNHLIRFGLDYDKFKSFDAESVEGGQVWRYSGNPATGAPSAPGSNLRVRRQVFQTGAGVEVNSKAYYIEDRWQITPNFLAYGGLRWDSFENVNGAGESFVEIKNQFGPRLGFSWDVNGDSKFKIYGNAGRYSLPLTATVAVRGASASLFTRQTCRYTGVDPVTGAPIGLNSCGGLQYINNEFGLGKDARSIADQNLKPMYQDEYILGFQAQLTDHVTGGVRGIYRDLKAAIDDQCDYRPIYAYAAANGLPFNPQNTGFAYCHLYNPGEDATFLVDVDGNGTLETINLAANVLGPKAKRTYKALEFFVEGSWDRLFLQGSYTWSKSAGNTEGGVKSDIGQDDTGTTQDFDYPELTVGSYGYLPNDRRHSFKLFGNYEINDQWSIGANLLVQSGRPVNCIGVVGADPGYGASYFSCGEAGVYVNARYCAFNPVPSCRYDNGSVTVPRGTRGRTDWSRTVDLNVAYKPNWAEGMTLKMDVFNLFNEHAVASVNEFGENGIGEPVTSTTYLTPTGFQQPRSFRFMVQYDF